jgi:Uma2 family endonuclease
MASTMIQPMTAETLWKMKPDGMRHELVKGELRTMAPSGAEHGATIMNLGVPLGHFVKAHKLGTVFGAETGFIVSHDPDTVRGADVAFVRKERLVKGIPTKFMPFAPDLAVEVVSPGDTFAEVEEKVDDWLGGGTSVVWVVNPRQRTVTIYRADAAAVRLTVKDTLDGSGVVKGFKLKVAQIFG